MLKKPVAILQVELGEGLSHNGVVGRRPQGLQARSVALPNELWERIERFREEQRLSNTAEAVRVLLWRVLDEIDEAKGGQAGQTGGS